MRPMVHRTQLSVAVPGSSDGVWDMAEGDEQPFGFDAEEAITSATAELIRLDTLAEAGTLSAVTTAGTVATVTVSGLERGYVYELQVTFTAATAGNRKWTRTLSIRCAA